MNHQKAIETLIRHSLPTIVAERYLAEARRDGTTTITIAGEEEGDSDLVIVVDYNRGGMENGYSISLN